jgi:ribosomal protein S18 acetylase RimI-like enzyme
MALQFVFVDKILKAKDMLSETPVFRSMQPNDKPIVAEMMKSLYLSLGAPAEYMSDQKIAATFKHLEVNPESLEIDVFEISKTIVGYALLFKFWYNEYGGMVLNVDELFVLADFRNRGISSLYLSALSERNDKYAALSLEVLPENEKAFALYKGKGFKEKETVTLHKILV